MMDNMQNPQEVPSEHGAPVLWLVSGDMRRRLRVRDMHLRTHVGIGAIIDQFVETISLEQVEQVEVLAPYAHPTSRLAMILIGCAIGTLIGSESDAVTGMVMAITILAFGLVALIVARSVPSAQRIARITIRNGRAYCIAYRHEDEPEIKQLFAASQWTDRTDKLMLEGLNPDEKHHADGLRIGIVLSTSALALIVLFVFGRRTDSLPSMIGVPADIVIGAAWAITIIVNAIAWGKMLVYRLKPLGFLANRRRP